LDLAGRDLTGAELSFADIRHVNFTHAILRNANLRYVRATQACFSHADLGGAELEGAQLQGARLNGAYLPDSLFGVQLQGADLYDVHLLPSSLDHAQLQGANLAGAWLQGHSLNDVHLEGASLDGADLQGALLNDVHLQGASLDDAHLVGVSLDKVNLQGALLDGAYLQGASLDHAQLQGASFVDVCVWRADARRAAWEDTRVVVHPTTALKADKVPKCDLTGAVFGDAATKRIKQRLDPKPVEGEDEMEKFWAARERKSPTPKAYAKSLAGQWRKIGCVEEGAPYVLQGVVAHLTSDPNHSPFRDQSDAAKALAAAFLDEAHCPGAHGLSEAAKVALKKIASKAAPKPTGSSP
jgi:uncharacterized protein YjbI with pentapeptide repeats